jgi:hypothetical protein
MKLKWFSTAACCASLASASFFPSVSFGQGTKPSPVQAASAESEDSSVVSVALNSLDAIVPNIQHLMRTSGAGAVAGTVTTVLNQYSNGLDRSRPFGVFVHLDDSQNNPTPIGCLPISDLNAFFDQLSVFGEANDLGNGLYEFAIGNTIYAKKVGPWLYVAQSEDSLEDVDGLGDSLKKLLKNYDLRIQVNPQNVPDELVDLFMSNMQAGFEQSMSAQRANMSEEEAAAAEVASEQMIKQTQELVEGTESLLVGLMINKAEKKTILDFGSKFVADTKYANQLVKAKASMASLQGTTLDASMMNLLMFQLIEQEDLAQTEKLLDSFIKTATKDIDNPAEAAKAKEYIARLVDILMESAKQGKMENAMDVSVDGPLSIVASFGVADGAKVESLASDVSKELKAGNAPAKLDIGTGKQGAFNLHKLTAQLPPNADDKVRKIFGDSVTASIGTSAKSVVIAVGKKSDAALKGAIDRIAAKPSAPAQMMKMRLTLSQVLTFAQSIESNPVVEAMVNAITSGNDKVMIDSEIADRAAMIRVTLEDGVIKAIAAGAKAGAPGAGGGF